MDKIKLPIVAIVGRANVGKSSLYNAVLKRPEAIVAREAGTTRDSISTKADFRGQQFWIVDTAGVKAPEDEFETTIQAQISSAGTSADIILVVIEAGLTLSDDDRRVAKLALKSRKPVILVVNKIDKVSDTHEAFEYAKLGITDIVATSTTQSIGITKLLERITSSIAKVPVAKENDRLKIALLGRPNVGKSSLFNAMLNKQQALVTERAGTTRDVNRATIRYKGQEIEVMDTAGIRRPGKIARGAEHFSVLRSLAAIEQADVCFLLIDANEPAVSQDQKIAGMVKEAGKGLALVVSKWDTLNLDEDTAYDSFIKDISKSYEFASWAPLIVTSSVSGRNVSKLFELALTIKDDRDIKVPTRQLNIWLKRTVTKYPPAGSGNHAPKLNYIVQEHDNSIPAFKIYGSQTKYVHWSYRRYLEREMREEFGFAGNPIQLWLIEKHIAHRQGVKPMQPDSKGLN